VFLQNPGEKPQRIFEDLQESLNICKDLQKIFEELQLPQVGVKILKETVRIL